MGRYFPVPSRKTIQYPMASATEASPPNANALCQGNTQRSSLHKTVQPHAPHLEHNKAYEKLPLTPFLISGHLSIFNPSNGGVLSIELRQMGLGLGIEAAI